MGHAMYHKCRNGTSRRYYRTADSHLVPYVGVPADYAEREVLDAVKSLSLTPRALRACEQELARVARSDLHKRERARLNREIQEARAAKVNAGDGYARRRLDEMTHASLQRAYDRELAELGLALAALPSIPDLAVVTPILNLRTHLAERVAVLEGAGETARLRQIVERLFSRIEVWGARQNGLHGRARERWFKEHPPETRCIRIEQ
jgi:hypothetical protein